MKLKINPTRQELLKIKKRLKTAQSGHKLLKEKLDGLMREFLENIKGLRPLKASLDEKLPPAYLRFLSSRNRMGPEAADALLSHIPFAETEVSFFNIMGVRIREGKIRNKDDVLNSPVSLISSDGSFYNSGKAAASLLDDILKYANTIIKIRLLAEEIERTRRRVNSLEHVYIPEMVKVKKYISQKLEERERFDRTVVLKLKELIS